jgi:hypothetical protein
MSLIDLKTNLKSLKFGNDQFNGGSSNQPYIQTPIPDGDLPVNYSDFLLRQGTVEGSIIDLKRIGKWFASADGIKFIAKQDLLSRIAVKTQASRGILNGGIYNPLNTLAEVGVVAEGVHLYKQGLNPINVNTYEEQQSNDIQHDKSLVITEDGYKNRLVELYRDKIEDKGISPNIYKYPGGPGTELGIGSTKIRFATDNTGAPLRTNEETNLYNSTNLRNTYKEQQSKYIKYDKDLAVNEGDEYFNRLVGLYQSKIGGDPNINGPINGIFSNDDVNIIQYNFPEKTYIRFATDNTGAPLRTNKTPKEILKTEGETWSSEDIEKAKPIQNKPITALNGGVIDFRTTLKNQIKSLPYSGSAARNIETRVNLGNPGSITSTVTNRSSYMSGIGSDISSSAYGASSDNSYDRINALPLYKSNVVNGGKKASITNDLVQFRIAAIDGEDPSQKIFMHFRAFLTSISDAYSADWNSTQYIGRGEKFYTYGGFDRKVSFGFTVAAQSKAELMPMYRKLNFLASNLAPDYSGNGYMKGSLVQLSIGGYFYEQPGFISSLTYDISEESMWEIGVSDKQDDSELIIGWSDPTVKELPHMIKVTVNFTPIHNFRPEKVNFGDNINKMPLNDRPVNTDETIGNYPTTRFIALANGSEDINSNYNNIKSQ